MIYGFLLLLMIGIFFLVLHLKRKEPTIKYDFKQADLNDKEIEFLDLVNAYRKTKLVHELIVDESASLTAFKHNFQMVLKEEVSHENYGDRASELMGYGAYEVGEITGGYYTSVSGAFKSFVASEKHEPLIKSLRYNVCGLDVMKNDKGKLFITCLFLKI